MVRSMQRKLQGIPVIRLKRLIDAMLKQGQAKIAEARSKEPSIPKRFRQRLERMRDRWTPMEQAFSELSFGRSAIFARFAERRWPQIASSGEALKLKKSEKAEVVHHASAMGRAWPHAVRRRGRPVESETE